MTGTAEKKGNSFFNWPSDGFNFLFLFLVCTFLFIYTVNLRKPWFGVLNGGRHQWVSGEALICMDNWIKEGAWDLRFAFIEQPASIELPALQDRGIYCSFPSGSMVPLYLFLKLFGRAPTPEALMTVNLANHYLIALFLGLTAYLFSRSLKFGRMDSTIFSLIPVVFELFMPGPLYFQQDTDCPEMAVILPFVLMLFTELLLDHYKGKKRWIIQTAQNFILVWGFLTEWLFVFIALAIYFKRIFEGQITNKAPRPFFFQSLRYWAAPALTMILYLWQIAYFGIFGKLWERFTFRTGMEIEPGVEYYKGAFETLFWGRWVRENFGYPIEFCLLFSMLILAGIWFIGRGSKGPERPRIEQILKWSCLALFPCLAHIYIFVNHSEAHDFSPMSLCVPMGLIPLVFTPAAFKVLLEGWKRRGIEEPAGIHWNRILSSLVPVIFLFFGLLLTLNEFSRFQELFPAPDRTFERIGHFIRDHTSYNDVVFSPASEIPKYPPVKLSYSQKRVYLIKDWNDLRDRVKDLPDRAVVNIFVIKELNPIPLKMLKRLSFEVFQQGDLFLFKMPLSLFKRPAPSSPKN